MDFNKLSIATFNMHGFRNGVSMLNDLCNNNYNIIAFQEHWLRSDECDRFNSIHDDYNCHAVSAMDDILSKDILRCRPFGGVGFLSHKCLNRNIQVLKSDPYGRCLATKLSIESKAILLFKLCLPCFE